MKKTMISAFMLVVLLACNGISQTARSTQVPAATPVVETDTDVPDDFACQETFEARAIKTGGKPHLALSAREWNGYLNLMGIRSICLPLQIGAPYVNADWDSTTMPATGRMVSIGFENFQHGAGWSDLFLLYSTYDFITGTEYDRFAELPDRDSLRSHSLANEIEVNGIRGFIRFKAAAWTYEGQPQIVYRSAVFPFENAYVAIVYKLGAGDADEMNRKFEQGEYPADLLPNLQLMDFLVNSLQFN